MVRLQDNPTKTWRLASREGGGLKGLSFPSSSVLQSSHLLLKRSRKIKPVWKLHLLRPYREDDRYKLNDSVQNNFPIVIFFKKVIYVITSL